MQAGGGVVEEIGAGDGKGGDGVAVESVAVGIAGEILDGAACAAIDRQAGIVGVIEAGQILDLREIAAVIEEDAIQSIVVGGDTFDDRAGGAVVGIKAVAAAVEREEADLHQVGIIEVDQIFVGVVGNRRGQLGDFGRVSGAAESEAAIGSQTDAGLGGGNGGVDHRIGAGIDIER